MNAHFVALSFLSDENRVFLGRYQSQNGISECNSIDKILIDEYCGKITPCHNFAYSMILTKNCLLRSLETGYYRS